MEERTLVQLSQAGNGEAFASLVKKYENKVFNLASSLTRNREVADDLSQDIFIKAYIALPKFELKSEFGTWLYRIAVNLIKDHLRKKTRIREIPFESIKENPFAQKDERLREEEQLEEHKRKIIHKFIKNLSKKHQIVLALRDIQGLSYEEISKILKISPGTVDSRLHRARKALRKKLEPFLSQTGGSYEMQES